MTGQSTVGSITAAQPGATVGALPHGIPARLFRGSRPLKRWRYVGVFSDEIMACAALVQIGPARQSFWALHVRGESAQRERTRLLPRRAEVELIHGRAATIHEPAAGDSRDASNAVPRRDLSETGNALPGRLRVRDLGVDLDLQLEEGAPIEALCPHGRAEVWTRKQAGVHAHGTLALDGGPPRAIEALAVIDDTAGHHARETEWWWSAGVGEGPGGTALAWNLVSGVNDPPSGSERAVWVDGRPAETPPVNFAADLSSVRCGDGAELRFTAETERARRDNLLVVRSDYRAPFGTFSGTLPGGIELTRGRGVVEHHRARW